LDDKRSTFARLGNRIPQATATPIWEQTHRYVVELPPVLGRDEWQRKYWQNPMLCSTWEREAIKPPENLQ
jgi:hypothetical protein